MRVIRYAHVARLDQDQQDWTSSLSSFISVSPDAFATEGDAMDALVVEVPTIEKVMMNPSCLGAQLIPAQMLNDMKQVLDYLCILS